MKKVIIMVVFLFVGALGVLGYYFADSKNNADVELYEINERQVDLVDSKALNDVKINDVVISNIEIVNNKKLIFHIKATKTDLNEKNINVILYNDYAKNPGASLESSLSDIIVKKDGYYEVNIDVSEVYNNPSRLEFELR